MENPTHQAVPQELLRGLEAPRQSAASSTGQAVCPIARIRQSLNSANLRPTRQRMLLGWLLFARGHRHLSAEELFEEARAARAFLSLATVYNTLNQFSEAGLLRKVANVGGRAIFDTNPDIHHHFLVEHDGSVIDIPPSTISLGTIPEPPPGYRIVDVDVVVRLRKKGASR
jgi:Fur family iron response transcriptional regulator